MNSGYDPMSELADSLDAATATVKAPPVPVDRRLNLAPPPTDDITAAIPRPAVVDENPPPPARATISERTADLAPAVVRAPRSRGISSLTATREPAKQVNARMPRPIVERLTRYRLDMEVAGTPIVVSERISDELMDLPSDPKRVVGELERYRAQLNVNRRPTDPEFVEEGTFATRIRQSSERNVALIIRAVHLEYGIRIDRQDLYGLALLRFLAKVAA